jgi:DNA repair exonuclease SbcCD nuclease subunit
MTRRILGDFSSLWLTVFMRIGSDQNGMHDGPAILAIGDVHLGTACSGVPDEISSWGLDPKDLTPAAALKLSVDFAIEQKLDAVLFAGDVVESTNARFEAILPLENSIRRLLDAGIQVMAVAGNHDVEALPRLAALIDGFILLGAGGRWEARTITKNQTPVAEVIGWSFGERYVRQSPVAQLLAEPLDKPSTSIPRIGLLHADLDASGGHYAPIRQAELDNTGYDAWLLGHIHKPSLESPSVSTGSPPSGYLGSLIGLDPSESGPHGPWLVRISNSGNLDLNQVPLAPLRWEHVSVSIDGLEHVEDVPDRLLSEAESLVRQLSQAGVAPRALGLRVQLTGSSPRYEEIRQRISAGEWNMLGRVVDDTAVFFNRIIDSMELRLDLADIAAGDDPAALMAQRLLTLQHDDDRSRALLEVARAELSHIAREDHWSPLQDQRGATDPLSDDSLRNLLLQSGKAALNAMLSRGVQDDRP